MSSDTDIDFMDYPSAREYVLNFITTLKRTQKDRGILQEELTLWEGRVKLADERREPTLKRGAEDRVAELKAKNDLLLREEKDLIRKISILKDKLKLIKTQSSLSVDADALLAQMQMVVGEEDTVAKALQEEEAQAALDDLKKKMNDGV
jgi:hypothetical protein